MAAWYLISEKQSGNGADQHKYRLRQQMIFVGREDCEMVLQSRSVDKQHAVIKYDLAEDVYKVKDLGSLNGTFLNESRIPEETYVTLHKKDTLRFGYDHHVFRIEHLEDTGEPWELKQLKSELVARRLKGRRSYSPPFYHAHCETCGHEVYQPHDSHGRHRDSVPSASPAYEQKNQSAKVPPLNGSRVRDMRRSPVSSVDIGIQTDEECVSQAEDNLSEEGTVPPAAEMTHAHGQKQIAQSPEVESLLKSESTQPESESSGVQETTESPLSLTSESTGTPSDLTPHAKRGTPLYGQPQWWGETEEGVGSGHKVNGRGHKDLPVREGNGDGRAGPPPAGSTNLRREQKERDAVLERMDETRREHKYFEIPATDFQQTEISPMNPSSKDMSDLKKKDSHLCFTVNLDDTSPLKLSVGDSVSKFAPSHRQQRKERTEGVGADEPMSSPRGMHRRRRSEHLEQTEREGSRQVEVMFSGSWRRGPAGQSDVTDDDSVHSDMPVSSRSKTGSQHLDGTRSESETESRHPHLHARVRPEEQRSQQPEMSPLAQADLHRRKKITPEDMLLDQRSFTVDFYDRKTPPKTKYPDSLKEKKGGVRGSVEKAQTRKGTDGAAPQQGKAEAGEKDSGSRPSSGKKRQSKEDAQDHPVDPDKDVCEEDKTSDAGTYTIELDEPNPEVEEARRKIDEVFGVSEPGEPQKAAKEAESPSEPGIQGPGGESQADHPASAEAESGGFGQVEVIFTGSWKRASQQPKRPVGPIAPSAPSWVHQWVSADQTTSPSAEGEQAGMPPLPSVVVTDRDVLGMDHQKPSIPRRKLSDASSQESPKTGRKRRTLPAIPKEKPSSLPSSRTTTPPVEKSTYPPGSVGSEESRHRERASELLEGERRIRRGSFTLDEDSPSILKELQPSAVPVTDHKDDTMKVLDAASDVSLDTAVLLKDTDSVIAALESRVKARHAEAQSQLEGSRRSPVGHVGRGRESSGDSDMDTVSTTSVADGDVGLIKSKSASRRSLSSQYWEKSHDGDKLRDTSAKQRLRESRRSDPYGDRSSTISDVLSSDADTQVGRGGITEKGGGAAFHIEFSAGSPEFSRGTPSRRSLGRGEKKSRPTDLQKSASMEVNKSGTFPKPRPTRASLLRRNRLESDSARSGPDSSGELEDYPETPSEASTASTSSTSSRPRPSSAKSSREMEMQARLDRLSKPRAGRLKDPPKSDRSDLSLGGQIVKAARASSGQPKQGSVRASPQAKTRTASGQGHSRSKSISSTEKGSGSSVWRRKSDAVEASGGNVWRRRKDNWEDHGSRSSTESAGDTTDRSESRVKRSKSFGDSARALRRGDRKKSTSNEGLHKSRKGYATTPDSGRSTTDEISRLSQQLAADLAILAQGAESDDGAKHVPKKRMDSKEKPKYATLPRAAKASKAAKHLTGIRKPRKELHMDSKGSKQLVERIFEDSMSKQTKSGGGPRGGSDREKESPTSSKRRQWRKEEPLDNLVITSVHRLSQKIKLTIDRTVAKARHVYGPDQPLPDVKSRDDADLPMLKSSNQEIAAILGNLRRVERQIEVLDRLIDPDDQIPVDSTEDDSSSTLVGPPASTPSSTGHRTPVSEYEQKTRSWQAADRSLSEQSEGMDSEDGEFDIHFNRFNPSGDEDYSTME
ncbi:centrosomal protein of 170 kDa-like isoform X6 [Branchiostoma floridae]|uniref:Centrosomal protein of 170 kDa-like isoform X6 n=1 Tax=Branchiostoma floridae TaxID=7739 RepID=A0A9J7KNI6_BRAFL|nr:centrosomal protein of 170 kDa-like isoform X6 [Branchiostoma floridae]